MSRPAVARLSGPAELVAALPVLCGFVPTESLVVVLLRRGRVVLTARYDLPAPEQHLLLVGDVVRRAATAEATSAFAVVCTDEEGARPRPDLAEALQDAPLQLLDVLLLRGDRWWSYRCRDAGCCPAGGTPVDTSSPGVVLVRAEAALQGRAVLPSRTALVGSLAPPDDPAAVEAVRAAEAALAEEASRGRAAQRRRLHGLLHAALDEPGDEAAELALALHDVHLRDEVLTWGLRRPDALLALLLRLAGATPAPWDAPVCACLAWVSHLRGDGATAGIALERALATDPDHGLARLLQAALDGQVSPRQLRAVTARTAAALERRR